MLNKPAMLDIRNLTYRIGGRDLITNCSVQIPAGHHVGMVGRNGVGKSTLLRLILDELQADDGEISMPRNLRVGAVAQEAPGGPESIVDTVLAADTERHNLLAELDTDPEAGRMAEIHERLVDIDAYGAPSRAATILAGLGFDEAAQRRPCEEYSGGWRMRVALAAALFLAPDLLLLDEPTNYLDIEGAMWLEGFLRSYRHTVLLVSHDRELLNRAVDHILHIEPTAFTLYRGGYDQFDRQRRERAVLQEKARARQEAQRKHIQQFVDRFRYKASKARQAQSRLKALARMEPIAAALVDPSVSFAIPDGKQLAPPLVSAEGVQVGYRPGEPVLKDLNFTIGNDDRIALLGQNGNGKSTFAKLLAGRLEPMAGHLHRNHRLSAAFFAQHQIEDLRPQDTAIDHLRRLRPDASETELRSHLGGYGLIQDRATTAAENLSGGEKSRLVLALITEAKPQLLILDEPTNHLDVDAREALIQALNQFSGSVILISHDRHFVELVADRLWLVAGGTVNVFDGDVSDYQNRLFRPRRAATPHQKPTIPVQVKKKNAAAKRANLAPLRRQLSSYRMRNIPD